MKDRDLPHDHGETQCPDSIQAVLDKTENFNIIADIFRQLGDSSRIRIFWLLCHMEECVTNIAAMMDMSSPAVSHHLRYLKTSRLITGRRDGKEVYYHAAESKEGRLLHQMIEMMMEVACPDADALPEHLNHSHSDEG